MIIISKMQIINGFDNLPKIMHAVATLGSYDGVHSGHQVLINQVIARAKARGGKSVVLTFEPHPRITLGKAEGLKLLSTIEEKALLLERLGVDYMLIIPFDLEFSRLSHQEFIESYLIEKLGIEELIGARILLGGKTLGIQTDGIAEPLDECAAAVAECIGGVKTVDGMRCADVAAVD